jgi:hypothetical protein
MHIHNFMQLITRWSIWLVMAGLLAACGGGGGSGGGSGNAFTDPGGNITDGGSYRITVELVDKESGDIVSGVAPLQPVTVRVTITRNNGDPIVSGLVRVELGSIVGTLVPGGLFSEVLTNGEGQAVVTLEAGDSATGAAGSIIVEYDGIRTDDPDLNYEPLNFEILPPPLQLGYFDNGSFMPGQVHIVAPSLSSTGTTPIDVTVLGPNGDVFSEPLQINFFSDCSRSATEPPLAVLISPVTTVGGNAISTYTTQGCRGGDILTAQIAAYPSITATGQLQVQSSDVSSILFISASPTVISIKGAGGAGEDQSEQSTLIFRVIRGDGQPASGERVGFALTTSVGGLSLSSDFGITDVNGETTVIVNSGVVATTVRVTGTIDLGGGNVASTVSEQLSVSSGLPDQDSMSISATVLNPGGGNFDGTETTINIRAADFFNNPVPDGTAVSFITEYGRIEPSCIMQNSTCSVIWNSQEPRQPTAYTFIDDDGQVASLRTIFNTDCTHPDPDIPRGVPCPLLLGQPYGGRSSILAFLLGQESFVDANGNGQWDIGEIFVDLSEAFLDTNEDGEMGNRNAIGSCYPDCPEEAGDEDRFIDLNSNRAFDGPNGIYNGILCSDTAEASGACSKDLVHVRAQATILVSGAQPYGAFYERTGFAARYLGNSIFVGSSSRGVNFYVSDIYNGALPSGTTVKFESDNCTVTPESATVPNTNGIGPTIIPVIIAGDENEQSDGTITVTVDAGGDAGGTGTFFMACEDDPCAFSPQPDFCTDGGA